MLGESGIVSSETLAVGIEKADSLLEVNPEDLRHLFFETMKELFYALREINPEDLDESDIDRVAPGRSVSEPGRNRLSASIP